MIRMMTAAMAAMTAAAVSAQAPSAPTPPAPMAGHHAMMMGDKVQTRDEALAMVRRHFSQMDTNRDGSIARDEIGAIGGKWAGRDGPHHGMMREHRMGGDPAAAFDRLDANKDGSISRDEFAKGREVRIERRIVMKDGKTTADGDPNPGDKRIERRVMRMDGKGPGKGGGRMRMIVMADGDGDGRITQAEAEAMALRHFDQMDVNRDGKVTPEERRAARPMMFQMRREKKAG